MEGNMKANFLKKEIQLQKIKLITETQMSFTFMKKKIKLQEY